MDISIKRNSLKLSTLVCDRNADFDVDCDVIVPDVKPDIARVLLVSAHTAVTSCETQTERVILSGTVFFNILYLSDDDIKAVKSIDAAAPFSNVFTCADISPDMLTLYDAQIKEVKCTVANCRKLSLGACVRGDIRVYGTRERDFPTDIENACVKKTSLTVSAIGAHFEAVQSFTDSFEIPTDKPTAVEILKCDAAAENIETKIIDDKAIIKGTLLITVLYNTAAHPDYISFEMPFARVLTADGIRADMITEPAVRIYNVTAALSANDSGEERVINVNASIFFRITAQKSDRCEFISDAYVPHASLTLEKEPLDITGTVGITEETLNFDTDLTLPESLPDISSVYRVIARPVCEECEISGGKLFVKGYTEVYLLYVSSDSDAPVFSFMQNVDFSHSVDFADGSSVPTVRCSLKNVGYIIKDERRASVRGSISLFIHRFDTANTEIVVNAKLCEAAPSERASVVISFLSEECTLWDIAKKYNISESDILRANGLDETASPKKECPLLIPR